MIDESYDALILGGGPAGATAALLLARAGWRVAVLEKAAYPRKKVCGEFLSATNGELLEELGLIDAFETHAGPEVHEVGIFAGNTVLSAPMPRTRAGAYRWGRALGREHLDTLLLAHAGQAGATVWQPWKAISLQRRQDGCGFECVAQHAITGQQQTLAGGLVLAAHGSWEAGALPTQPSHRGPQAGDLHGFKAHFHASRLRPGLMPLLAFPGGYGGMVHADQGRTSLSCCIRFDQLASIRRQRPGIKAADAVLEHLAASCRGVAEALDGARLDGAWLAAGPIRPGFRKPPEDGIFLLGNAAGEAHPIVAEGISMALQSAWLACQAVLPLHGHTRDGAGLAAAAAQYQGHWNDAFATRIRVSAVFAQLAVRPGAARALLPLLRACPGLLTMAARWSGKSRQIIPRAAARPRAA